MGCMVEYSLDSCDVSQGSLSDCTQMMSREWKAPYDMDLVFMYGHQHFAGLGTTLYRCVGVCILCVVVCVCVCV